MHDKDNKIRRLVVFGGDGAAGKTSMFLYHMGKLPAEYIPVKIGDYVVKDYSINGKTVSVAFCDNEGGGEDWHTLRHLGYEGADCVVLCFVIDQSGFEYIEEYWYPFTQKYCPKAKLILVGMKKDLRNDQDWIERLAKHNEKLITYEEGKRLAKEIKAECYLECSSVSGEGIEDVFNKAAEVASTVNINRDRRKCCIL